MSVATGKGLCARALRETYRAFRANKTSWIGLTVFLGISGLAILAPWIAPHDPIEQRIERRLESSSSTYRLGTDTFGRDVLSRLLWGARISLIIGTLSILLAMVVGGGLGILAGYKGRKIDLLIMRVMDVLLSFPILIMGLLIVAVLGPSMVNLIMAIALTVIPKFARIARGPTVALREREFIEACRAMGSSDLRVMGIHILPNVLGEVLVMASLWTATAVRIEASLAFIGLGVRPPTPTWGSMIRDGFENILDAPWLSIYPGLCVLALVFSLNLLGDGLRDAADPKLRDG
ncbi:MAG: ABC transporter permease [Candidatus Rokubacteria bacterium RIFCSPLOWO2_12_FULL_71_19]|nr:MAG: ABC transporter permease [Candidatus Rokubacteria bacterium RIFCSPLOWO2_12_FULL_71_19]